VNRKLVLIACVLLFAGCSGMAYRNPTENMMPAISPNDMCVVNPIAYSTGEIQRFDIVVFEMPDQMKRLLRSNGEVRVMMRVVGLPGEKVEVRENQVFVNDLALDEPYERIVDAEDKFRNFGPINVPENEYFVLSDNRANGMDSRYKEYGTIKQNTIYSKVVEVKRGYYADK
jgi:signal peptidase I